jgi:fumarate reductase subunit D
MRYKIDTIEPVWWALFGAGGMVAALILPIMIYLFGIALPLGSFPFDSYSPVRMQNLLGNWLVKLFLLVIITLPLFHWAHRFRYFLFDLGIRGGRQPIAVICYGLAVVLSVVAVITIITL